MLILLTICMLPSSVDAMQWGAMFKTLFKFYKNKANILCDTNELECCLSACAPVDLPDGVDENVLKILGLVHPTKWQIFEHQKQSGLLVVKNIFTNEGQRYWIRRCVIDYPTPPSLNNLTPVGLLSNEENWFDVCSESIERKTAVYRKLRWVTLGYHHNWDTKVYSEGRHSQMPEDLSLLCDTVAKTVVGVAFSAEAAIVNYYYHNSTISGHIDHSEPNLDAPLLSFSFGDSAVFLVGGSHQEDPASPILVRSGDLVIMSGPSRLSLHGVPRIIPAVERPWEDVSDDASDNDKLVSEFISLARINMNVRQVLFPGEKVL